MLIVADENIPLLDAFFEHFGEIRRVAGRSIDRATVDSVTLASTTLPFAAFAQRQPLTPAQIKLEALAKKHQVEYDGWGTYFEGDEDEMELDDEE